MKAPFVINGWSIYAHPLFLDQIEDLIAEVEARKTKDPKNYKSKISAKRLAAVLKLIKQTVPANPESPEFRQGNTLGKAHKHWFRATFMQQYRLFFRYVAKTRIIVFVWMNDDKTKRAYGNKTDAYETFRSMLERGNPLDDLPALLAEEATPSIAEAYLKGKQP